MAHGIIIIMEVKEMIEDQEEGKRENGGMTSPN